MRGPVLPAPRPGWTLGLSLGAGTGAAGGLAAPPCPLHLPAAGTASLDQPTHSCTSSRDLQLRGTSGDRAESPAGAVLGEDQHWCEHPQLSPGPPSPALLARVSLKPGWGRGGTGGFEPGVNTPLWGELGLGALGDDWDPLGPCAASCPLASLGAPLSHPSKGMRAASSHHLPQLLFNGCLQPLPLSPCLASLLPLHIWDQAASS